GSRVKMDIGQYSARQNQKYQTNQTPGEQPTAPLPGLMAIAENLPGFDGQQQRKYVGEIAQRHEQDIGEPGTGTACGVLHLLDVTGMTPARILLVVGQQGHPEIEAQRSKGDQRTLLETVVQLL